MNAEKSHLHKIFSRVVLGDRAAIGDLINITRDDLYGVAFNILKNTQDAEDSLNRAYFEIWSNAKKYNETRATPIAWMCTIVRSRSLDLFRKRSRYELSFCPESEESCCVPAPANESPESVLQSHHESSMLEYAITRSIKLERNRKLVDMAFKDHMSHSEIASETGMALGTVKSILNRAQRHIKDYLQSNFA